MNSKQTKKVQERGRETERKTESGRKSVRKREGEKDKRVETKRKHIHNFFFVMKQKSLSVNFTKDNIESTNDGNNIGKKQLSILDHMI